MSLLRKRTHRAFSGFIEPGLPTSRSAATGDEWLHEIIGRREPQAQEAAGGVDSGPGGAEGAPDKKMVGPVAKREAVAHLRNVLQMSERRACNLVAADRKMIRYRSRGPPNVELRTRLRDLANQRRRFGYRRLFILLRDQGEPSGVNRIYRLYREEGLTVRKRKARRRAVGTRTPTLVEARVNAGWSLDFVHDQFAFGRRFRILNIVDDVTRECLAAIPDTSISGKRVARELTAIINVRGKPGMIVSDNVLRRESSQQDGQQI